MQGRKEPRCSAIASAAGTLSRSRSWPTASTYCLAPLSPAGRCGSRLSASAWRWPLREAADGRCSMAVAPCTRHSRPTGTCAIAMHRADGAASLCLHLHCCLEATPSVNKCATRVRSPPASGVAPAPRWRGARQTRLPPSGGGAAACVLLALQLVTGLQKAREAFHTHAECMHEHGPATAGGRVAAGGRAGEPPAQVGAAGQRVTLQVASLQAVSSQVRWPHSKASHPRWPHSR